VELAGDGTADLVAASVSYRLAAGAEVEVLRTTSNGGSAAISLTGNEFAQDLLGNAGGNRLEGKGGADTLRGLGGADTFVFATKLDAGNIDRIVDFTPVDDRLLLSNNIFSVFGERQGAILPGHFRADANGQARDASDHFIYDTDDGGLFYDADGFGAGARIQFATIGTGLALTNADFILA
jgi:Ca2+-binding RTX toxin-like protein